MTHTVAEVTVPVGAVNAVAAEEKHGIRHIGQIVICPVQATAAFHFGGPDFVPNAILPHRGAISQTTGNQTVGEDLAPFMGYQFLFPQINFYPFIVINPQNLRGGIGFF